jgi:hypothetical protein
MRLQRPSDLVPVKAMSPRSIQVRRVTRPLLRLFASNRQKGWHRVSEGTDVANAAIGP